MMSYVYEVHKVKNSDIYNITMYECLCYVNRTSS